MLTLLYQVLIGMISLLCELDIAQKLPQSFIHGRVEIIVTYRAKRDTLCERLLTT